MMPPPLARAVIVAAMTVWWARPVAFAQTPPGLCYPYPVETQVRVDTSDGRTIRGRLVCLTDSQVVVRSKDGRHMEERLAIVRRVSITNRADSIADGVLKGAALGLAGGLFGAEGCQGDHGACVFQAAVSLGIIGGLLDWRRGDRPLVIYPRRPK